MTFETDQDRWALIEGVGIKAEVISGKAPKRFMNVIFDDEHMSMGDDLQMSTTEPKIFVRTSDAKLLKREDTIFINSIKYHVRDNQPDGTGCTMLMLKVV